MYKDYIPSFDTETEITIFIDSQNGLNTLIEVGYDLKYNAYIYFTNISLIFIDVKGLQDINRLNENKVNSILIQCEYDNSTKVTIKKTDKNTFTFLLPNEEPLHINSKDMSKIAVFLENCLINKLLGI